MCDFVFRISRQYDEVDLNDLYDLCDKVVVFEHPSDDEVSRTHIHGLCIGCKRKEDTIRNKFFKSKYDKTDYSLKTKDVNDGFITYMGKGNLVPKYLKDYDPVYVFELVQKWVDPPKKNIVKLENGRFVRNPDEPGKKTKRQLLESMRSRFTSGASTRDTLKIIRKVLIENNEVVGMYKIMDYYDSLMMYSDKDTWLDMISLKINSRTRV